MKDLFKKKDKRSDVEKEYDNAVKLLSSYAPGSDDYNEQLEIVERLGALLKAEKESKKTVSPDVVVSALLSTVIPVMGVLHKETLHNVTSKALNFIPKGKLK